MDCPVGGGAAVEGELQWRGAAVEGGLLLGIDLITRKQLLIVDYFNY